MTAQGVDIRTQPTTHGRAESPSAGRSDTATASRASCGGCPRRWAGMLHAHCPTCHRHFGSVSGFDRHRVNGKCLDPGTLTDRHGNPVLEQRHGPHGVTWVRVGREHHWDNSSPE